MRSSAPLPAQTARPACASCGTAFECHAHAAVCWCAALPPLERIEPTLAGCMCAACLRAALAHQDSA